MGWWRFVKLSLEAMIEPADAAACDRAMEQLARESRLGAALHRASWIIRSAWSHSRTRRGIAAIGRHLTPMRLRGWLLVVVGTTALVLNASKPTPVGPLSALLPSLVVAGGVLVMLMARPLSRALANRNS